MSGSMDIWLAERKEKFIQILNMDEHDQTTQLCCHVNLPKFESQ